MVRRDAGRDREAESRFACGNSPAGESPVPVGAGAPGSRPQVSREDPCARAGRQEPLRREQERGPQHEVKPAASSDSQSGSRAAHFTAKATSVASDPEHAAGPGGVGGAARVQGEVLNSGDPSAQPLSRRARSYKPRAKSGRVQRESEGDVVLSIAATNNAVGGKVPCGGEVGGRGKREGMIPETGSNHPHGREPVDKVRRLQRRLWIAAKQSSKRRFHALYDRIYRDDVLWEAWKRVRRNRGAAGVDRQTLVEVEQYGVERLLGELREQLCAGKYRAGAVLRRYIAKPSGGERALGIPTVRDRVVQTAAKLVLEPIFQADLPPEQYAYRPNRSALDAVRHVHKLLTSGHGQVVDADLSGYFDSIPHAELMRCLARRIVDGAMLHLIKMWLEAPVEEEDERGQKHRTTRNRDETRGTPQGAPISPLLSNLYMRRFVLGWKALGHEQRLDAHIVNYADDFVILCRSEEEAQRALAQVRQWTAQAGRTLHPEKTRIVTAQPKGGFDFLGYHFARGYRWPRPKSAQKLKATSRPKTKRTNGQSLAAIILDVTRTVRGWFEYFKHSHRTTVPALDSWVRMRLRSILRKRTGLKGRGRGADHQRWPHAFFQGHGRYSMTAAHALLRQSSWR